MCRVNHIIAALVLSLNVVNVYAAGAIDLSPQENTSVDATTSEHVLSNPWWRNLDVYGFAGFGYYDTGDDGTRKHGSFEVKEATLFVEADIWETSAFFLELQTNRLGADESKFTRTGEVYVHFRNQWSLGNTDVSAKVGRIDIPFGEEYLWQDAIDNPLITQSASYPYGWDEGVLVYGTTRGLGWIFALTDGTDDRSAEDQPEKSLNAKFYGNVTEALYLSLSLMSNGDVGKSAIEFGGSHFEPVPEAGGATNTTEFVDANLYELDLKVDFDLGDRPGYLSVAYGGAKQQDLNPVFDRDFEWLTIEPYFSLTDQLYLVIRYSRIGTNDNTEGYHFDGKTFAGGNDAFGYDVKNFSRTAIGLGYTPNPRTVVKFEVGEDDFELIESSTRPNGGDRDLVALEVAVGF